MANSKMTRADRARFQTARARGAARLRYAAALAGARYDRPSDTVVLTFRGGSSMKIPRDLIPGLERQPTTSLEAMTLSPARNALLWASLDVDVYLPGLIERAFGKRLFASARRWESAKYRRP
jgi:hypothetical protein